MFKSEMSKLREICYYFYNNNIDRECMNDIKNRLFYFNNTVGDNLILNLSHAIVGDHTKKIFFGLGDTNAGKSIIVNACPNTFEDYIGTFNAENLSHRDTSPGEVAQMRWSLLLRYKPIIFSNELKNTIEVNGNAMIKHSSDQKDMRGLTIGEGGERETTNVSVVVKGAACP